MEHVGPSLGVAYTSSAKVFSSRVAPRIVYANPISVDSLCFYLFVPTTHPKIHQPWISSQCLSAKISGVRHSLDPPFLRCCKVGMDDVTVVSEMTSSSSAHIRSHPNEQFRAGIVPNPAFSDSAYASSNSRSCGLRSGSSHRVRSQRALRRAAGPNPIFMRRAPAGRPAGIRSRARPLSSAASPLMTLHRRLLIRIPLILDFSAARGAHRAVAFVSLSGRRKLRRAPAALEERHFYAIFLCVSVQQYALVPARRLFRRRKAEEL